MSNEFESTVKDFMTRLMSIESEMEALREDRKALMEELECVDESNNLLELHRLLDPASHCNTYEGYLPDQQPTCNSPSTARSPPGATRM